VDWIDANYVYHSKILDFFSVGTHVADWTSEQLVSIARNYNIADKLSAVVGDTTASMITTMKETCNGSNKQAFAHACFAHVFQLCIRDALEDPNNDEVTNFISKLKRIVSFVNQSSNFYKYLQQEYEHRFQQPFTKPKNCNQTRWDSIFLMIESVIDNLYFISESLHNFKTRGFAKKVPIALENAEILVGQRLYNALVMLRNVTLISQEKERSIASIIPLYNYVIVVCRKCKRDNNVFIQKFGTNLQNSFLERMNNTINSMVFGNKSTLLHHFFQLQQR